MLRLIPAVISNFCILFAATPAAAQQPNQGMPRNPGVIGGFDPNRLFDGMDRNRDGVVTRDEIQDRRTMGRFEEYMRRAGVTDGRLTREAFLAALQQRLGEQTQRAFRDLDRNRDGRLDSAEIQRSSRLRTEWERWDTSRDGSLDFNELRPFLEGRNQRNGPTTTASGSPSGTPQSPEMAGGFRPGKLPPNLPEWFTELDRDNDGQVALHEWKDRPLEDFMRIDRNRDGFLTIEETVRHGAATEVKGKAPNPSDPPRQ
jgi:Ca2+-binding EF-hand superfamily protein